MVSNMASAWSMLLSRLNAAPAWGVPDRGWVAPRGSASSTSARSVTSAHVRGVGGEEGVGGAKGQRVLHQCPQRHICARAGRGWQGRGGSR